MTNLQTLWIKMAMAALLAALLAVVLTPFVKKLAFRFGVVREPRERDMHAQAMPLWGGLAMFAAFEITVLILRPLNGQAFALAEHGSHPILGVLLGAALIAVVGMLDDRYDLKPLPQTLTILAGAFVAAALGARVDGVTNPFVAAPTGGGYNPASYIPLGAWSIPITMIWIYVVTKTFDFMDGLDGLAAGICAIAATTMGVIALSRPQPDIAVALMAAALAGSCIGFLRHNYNPASIFMGTVGAQFLGFVLAALAVVGTVKGPAVLSLAVPLLVVGVPVFDGIYVALRRVLKGKTPFAADKTHIHHRMRGYGWSTKKTVLAIYGLTACTCFIALLLSWWAH